MVISLIGRARKAVQDGFKRVLIVRLTRMALRCGNHDGVLAGDKASADRLVLGWDALVENATSRARDLERIQNGLRSATDITVAVLTAIGHGRTIPSKANSPCFLAIAISVAAGAMVDYRDGDRNVGIEVDGQLVSAAAVAVRDIQKIPVEVSRFAIGGHRTTDRVTALNRLPSGRGIITAGVAVGAVTRVQSTGLALHEAATGAGQLTRTLTNDLLRSQDGALVVPRSADQVTTRRPHGAYGLATGRVRAADLFIRRTDRLAAIGCVVVGARLDAAKSQHPVTGIAGCLASDADGVRLCLSDGDLDR